MIRQAPATIAIVSANTVVENALALLLEGVGYGTRLLEESSAVNSGEHLESHLEGVDLLLLTPALGEKQRETLLNVIRAASATADMPVLTLSTARKEELNDQKGMMHWPARLEDLRRAIEAALAPAPSVQG